MIEFEKLFENSRKWSGIVIHHSATKDGVTNDWGAIKRYHIEHNGWSDIGYHFGIETVDNMDRFCIGRPLSVSGAHAKGMNYTHIGICVVGNYDVEIPSQNKYDMLVELIEGIKRYANIGEIIGHWETYVKLGWTKDRDEAWKNFKTCPGKLFDLDYLRSRITDDKTV